MASFSNQNQVAKSLLVVHDESFFTWDAGEVNGVVEHSDFGGKPMSGYVSTGAGKLAVPGMGVRDAKGKVEMFYYEGSLTAGWAFSSGNGRTIMVLND
jgi:hypothetical protein